MGNDPESPLPLIAHFVVEWPSIWGTIVHMARIVDRPSLLQRSSARIETVKAEGRQARIAWTCIEKGLRRVRIRNKGRHIGTLFCFDLCAESRDLSAAVQRAVVSQEPTSETLPVGHCESTRVDDSDMSMFLMRVLLEPLRLCRNAVFARRAHGERIVPAIVGFSAIHDQAVAGSVAVTPRTGNSCAGRVGDRCPSRVAFTAVRTRSTTDRGEKQDKYHKTF